MQLLLAVSLLLGSSSLCSLATLTELQGFSHLYAESTSPNSRHVEQTKEFDTFVNASGALEIYFSAWDDLTVFGRFTSGSTYDYDILVNHSSTGRIDGALTTARFDKPKGIAIDPSITDRPVMYIAEEGNFVIRRMDVFGDDVTTFAGDPSSSTAVDGSTSVSRFNIPFSLQFNYYGGSYTLYISEKVARSIRFVFAASLFISLAVCKDDDFSDEVSGAIRTINMGTQIVSTLKLSTTADRNIIDPNRNIILYVNTVNHKVRAINLQTNEVTTLIGGNQGYGDGCFA
eukprot:jgi/Bigna1/79158/fgenesh1_pg.60_\